MSSEASPTPWLNPAGGLRYHLRGFRYAKGIWWPFRFALAEWLYTWQPPERRLVIVGPSAGYCLEPLTLERFDEIIALEPDPVARFLFARRLQKAPLEHRPRVRFESRDLILGDPARFRTFLDELGGAAVLFSNFLGQLRVLLRVSGPDPRLDEAKRTIAQALAGRSWASFHDRVSGALSPDGREPLDTPRRLTDDEVTEGIFGGQELASQAGPLIGPGGDRPLLDHLTHGIFPSEQPYRYFIWELEPGQFHLIEATWHRESPAD